MATSVIEPETPELPDQVDFDAVAAWLSHCDEQHGPQCRTTRYAETAPSSGGIYLLDVLKGSIVPAKLSDRFVALSYVWGGVAQLQLLRSNRDALTEPDALRNQLFWPSVRQTIRDAISVTQAVGERYLWVDALCICQDDLEHKREQINQMAAIYGASALTIVACTAESADSPLPGVLPGTRLPHPIPNGGKDAQLFHSVGGIDFVWNYVRAPHHGRAWTFQEVVLSRRCLYFFGNQVILHCQESRRQEGGDEEAQGSMNQAGNWPPLEADFPSHSFRYGELVHDFTRRNLTFPTDRLDAFSGLTSALNVAWEWTFHYALPLQDFSRALLWVPEDPVALRTKGEETLPLPTEYLFPSWSWLSHPGPSYYLLEQPAHCIQSFIDWPNTSIWDGKRSRSLGAANGRQAEDPENPDDDDSGAGMFEGYPPGTMVIMAYAAGLKDLGVAPASPEMDRFEEKRAEFGATGSTYTPLVSQEGKWYGTLLGISESQLRDLLQKEDSELALVPLSSCTKSWVMGGFRRPIPCFNFSEYKNEDWCTYNVILISFGERPYRKLAVGEIHRDEWEKMDKEPDLIWLA